jgi:hypothetical protein
MVDAMNHDNSKQPSTHDLKKSHIATIETKYIQTQIKWNLKLK